MLKSINHNIRNRFIAGLLLLIPFAVTIVIIRWLFTKIYRFLDPLIRKVQTWLISASILDTIPPVIITGLLFILTIFIIVFLIYMSGTIGQIVAGKRLLAVSESVVVKIPLVGIIYSATKQVLGAVSMPDRGAFKSVVMVQFPRPGFFAIAFLTGSLRGAEGKTYCKVFIPTAPNPTSGFFEIIPPDEVQQTNLTIEDAFKMIISGGLVSPESISVSPINHPESLLAAGIENQCENQLLAN